MITIPREICRDLDKGCAREWLVTNGRGSYACSTLSCLNTRRYHGLLVAALEPPLKRTVLVAKVDEEIEAEGFVYRMGTNEYQNNVLNPEGYLFLQQVLVDGMIPTLHYLAAPFQLTKTIWMEHDRDTTYIRYQLGEQSRPIHLTLLPFCDYRDFHNLTHAGTDWRFKVEPLKAGFLVQAHESAQPYRVMVVPGASFTPLDLWYWHFEFRTERERGLDHEGDYFLPGLLRTRLEPNQAVTVILTCETDDEIDFDSARALDRALARQRTLSTSAPDDFPRQLRVAADQFIVHRPAATNQGPNSNDMPPGACSVLAGYSWFGDRGRDTMIALEGLTMTTGRFALAREILLTYAHRVSEGMLPSRFADVGQAPEYNSVDAALWFFHAIDRYLSLSGDSTFLRELFPILQEIIASYLAGTRHQIHVDPQDGLLFAGEPGVALTWMDARTGDWVVTPRTGKAVEVNALWFNALCMMHGWADQLGEPSETYRKAAEQAAQGFARFWYAEGGYLYDVLDGPGGNDPALRPNQLLALSLAHSPLPPERAQNVFDRVQQTLWTPFGLRTLASGEPAYRGEFKGDLKARDSAYHNGTVYPWLLGPYLDAMERCYPGTPRRILFDPLAAHLTDAGIGTISECFDGNPPHNPGGCIAQARSVAEVLRAYLKIKE